MEVVASLGWLKAEAAWEIQGNASLYNKLVSGLLMIRQSFTNFL